MTSYKCLVCKAALKRAMCVPCQVCEEYTHPDCSNISKDLLKYLIDETKEGTSLTWTCEHCTKVGKVLNNKVKALNKEIMDLKKEVAEIQKSQSNVIKDVETVKEDNKKQGEAIKKSCNDVKKTIFDELRQREERKLNLIVHGVAEAGSDITKGVDRKEFDWKCILEICSTLGTNVSENDIKFHRRIGEKHGDKTVRPILIGVNSMQLKTMMLKNSKKLQNCDKYKDAYLVPDLTKQQREEEEELVREMHKKNAELDTETGLNSQWRLVGMRGEKRLVLGRRMDTNQWGSTRGGGGRRGGGVGGGRGRGGLKRGRTSPEKTAEKRTRASVRLEEEGEEEEVGVEAEITKQQSSNTTSNGAGKEVVVDQD